MTLNRKANRKPLTQNIARALKTGRKKLGMSQIEMSKVLGISQSSISKLEAAILEPSAIDWIRFCQISSTPPDIFMKRRGRGSFCRSQFGDPEANEMRPKRPRSAITL